jgi:hypothetical protein
METMIYTDLAEDQEVEEGYVRILPCDKCGADLLGDGSYDRVLGCGRCVGGFCGACGYQWSGLGPMGCPDEGFRGHGYDAEQTQPPVAIKHNKRRGWRRG